MQVEGKYPVIQAEWVEKNLERRFYSVFWSRPSKQSKYFYVKDIHPL